MKTISVVGARPQFIKAAAVSRELRKKHKEILVHTGQHYDRNMSTVFFDQLGIPKPDYNLGIGSGSQGMQTGAMLTKIEAVLLIEKPEWVLVYGDTNSTLAGALAAAKLHIPVAHVEAGLRSFNRQMPEEINRVLTDHISDLLLCPSQIAVDNLQAEGITQGVHLIGDVMYDALMYAIERAAVESNILDELNLKPKQYLLATVHRAENTDNDTRLFSIFTTLNSIEETIVLPLHPRTRKALEQLNYRPASQIQVIEPLGYLDMVMLEKSARMILTDSGGIQKEAYWLGVPCLTLRDETEWVETVDTGWNKIVGTDENKILFNIQNFVPSTDRPDLYKSSCSSSRIVNILS